MGESSNEQVNDRAIVIQRAGELSEFVSVLEDLAVPVEIHSADALPTPDEVAGAAVVVALGTRLLDGGTPNLSLWPRTLAVADNASKTLVAHLNRVGAALVIRRPIHPRTLRLLFLHEIYRGPERRKRKRTLIGHPIRVGTGLFKQRATLLELSDTGARVEMPKAPKIGGKLSLLIGKDVTLGKPLKLQAKVVRCIRASGEKGRQESEIGVALVDPRKQHKAVAAILDRFSSGPASWSGKVESDADTAGELAPTVAEVSVSRAETVDPSDSARRLPPSKSPKLPPTRSAAPVVDDEAKVTEDVPDEAGVRDASGADDVALEAAADTPVLDDVNAGAAREADDDIHEEERVADAPVAEAPLELDEATACELDVEAAGAPEDRPDADADDGTGIEFELESGAPATDDEAPDAEGGDGDQAGEGFENEVASALDLLGDDTDDGTTPSDADDDERRRDPRIPYDRRVVALGEEAARVLVGRDLSHGGMRIASTDTVDVGDTLRVALHCGTELEPLVVLATALRDDGIAGIVLAFQELSDGQRDHLEKIIASSSPIQAGDDEDFNARTGSVVMGEMLETVSKSSDEDACDPNGESGPVETEAEIDAHLDSIFDTDEPV